MEKTKPSWEETRRALEVDVEYELRTTAPQVEMEQYYNRKKAEAKRKIRKINKQIKKYEYKLKNNIYKRTQRVPLKDTELRVNFSP